MKLTSIDIQQQEFRRTLRGFDAKEVTGFLELVSQQMGELARDNSELQGELRRVRGELENFREREATLKEAMMTAQRAIDDIRCQAEKQAELMVTEAELRAEKLLYNAHQRVSRVLEDIHDLKRQRTRSIEEMRGVLKLHGELLALHDEQNQAQQQSEGSVTVLDRIRPPAPPQPSAEILKGAGA